MSSICLIKSLLNISHPLMTCHNNGRRLPSCLSFPALAQLGSSRAWEAEINIAVLYLPVGLPECTTIYIVTWHMSNPHTCSQKQLCLHHRHFPGVQVCLIWSQLRAWTIRGLLGDRCRLSQKAFFLMRMCFIVLCPGHCFTRSRQSGLWRSHRVQA